MLQEAPQSAAQWGLKVDPSPKPDRMLNDSDRITIGEINLDVLHTPGHSPGGICLYDGASAVFVGDTLFAGSVGRSDFPGGDHDTLITSIRTKLFSLPDEVVVYPGHMTNTTIGREKKTNPFCGLGA
jgi:hydroxyacylglutathione hydrolase